MRKLGRPTNDEVSRRMSLTLAPEDHDLLKAYAHQVGRRPATVAVKLVMDQLHGGMTEDGKLDAELVSWNLRRIRGTEDADQAALDPRWQWPLNALLGDRRWWDRLLPSLNELLGRGSLVPNQQARGRPGERETPSPISDRRGYSDLMEYLFPAKTTSHGTVTWRDRDYGLVGFEPAGESVGADAEVWEATVRHVAMALDAIDETIQPGANAVYRIQVQEHITGPWLQTLSFITGEGKPEPLPESRLA